MQAGVKGCCGKTGLAHRAARRVVRAERVVAMTRTDPPGEPTHWTATIIMGQGGRVSASARCSALARKWAEPHRCGSQMSTTRNFVDKLRDVVGSYVDPRRRTNRASVREEPDPARSTAPRRGSR